MLNLVPYDIVLGLRVREYEGVKQYQPKLGRTYSSRDFFEFWQSVLTPLMMWNEEEREDYFKYGAWSNEWIDFGTPKHECAIYTYLCVRDMVSLYDFIVNGKNLPFPVAAGVWEF